MIGGELAQRAAQLAAERAPFVLATVVHARRPTSVRPGDTAIVEADGTIDGFVGGVCAASSVRLHALRALETGEALLLRLVPGDAGDGGASPGDRGASAGDRGGVPGDPGDADPDATSTVEGAIVERNPCLSGGSLEIFLEPQLPAPRIVVIGAAPIAVAVRKLARSAGYEIADSAPRQGDAAVIVASHGSSEEQVLSEALRAGVPYVGLVASRKRGEAVRAALDVPDELRVQLHTPAGLDLGARTPSEIAVSILAELIREHHAHPGAPATASMTDPVCGMDVVAAETTVSLETAAGRVYFCGERCRDAYAGQHASELIAH
jgi:xanthine dehydrogenase accessory factor